MTFYFGIFWTGKSFLDLRFDSVLIAATGEVVFLEQLQTKVCHESRSFEVLTKTVTSHIVVSPVC